MHFSNQIHNLLRIQGHQRRRTQLTLDRIVRLLSGLIVLILLLALVWIVQLVAFGFAS